MLIPQVPIQPTQTLVTPPQALPNALPNVLTQAVAPISQRAIPPTQKADGGHKTRRRADREPQGEGGAQDSQGDHVNFSV